MCNSSGSENQIKGRLIDTSDSSEKKKEHVDELIDAEIQQAYTRATQLLNENSKLHIVLIDAMVKFKTLGLFRISFILEN